MSELTFLNGKRLLLFSVVILLVKVVDVAGLRGATISDERIFFSDKLQKLLSTKHDDGNGGTVYVAPLVAKCLLQEFDGMDYASDEDIRQALAAQQFTDEKGVKRSLFEPKNIFAADAPSNTDASVKGDTTLTKFPIQGVTTGDPANLRLHTNVDSATWPDEIKPSDAEKSFAKGAMLWRRMLYYALSMDFVFYSADFCVRKTTLAKPLENLPWQTVSAEPTGMMGKACSLFHKLFWFISPEAPEIQSCKDNIKPFMFKSSGKPPIEEFVHLPGKVKLQIASRASKEKSNMIDYAKTFLIYGVPDIILPLDLSTSLAEDAAGNDTSLQEVLREIEDAVDHGAFFQVVNTAPNGEHQMRLLYDWDTLDHEPEAEAKVPEERLSQIKEEVENEDGESNKKGPVKHEDVNGNAEEKEENDEQQTDEESGKSDDATNEEAETDDVSDDASDDVSDNVADDGTDDGTDDGVQHGEAVGADEEAKESQSDDEATGEDESTKVEIKKHVDNEAGSDEDGTKFEVEKHVDNEAESDKDGTKVEIKKHVDNEAGSDKDGTKFEVEKHVDNEAGSDKDGTKFEVEDEGKDLDAESESEETEDRENEGEGNKGDPGKDRKFLNKGTKLAPDNE